MLTAPKDVEIAVPSAFSQMQCGKCGCISFSAWVVPPKLGIGTARLYGLQCEKCGNKFRLDDHSHFDRSGMFHVPKKENTNGNG